MGDTYLHTRHFVRLYTYMLNMGFRTHTHTRNRHGKHCCDGSFVDSFKTIWCEKFNSKSTGLRCRSIRQERSSLLLSLTKAVSAEIFLALDHKS